MNAFSGNLPGKIKVEHKNKAVFSQVQRAKERQVRSLHPFVNTVLCISLSSPVKTRSICSEDQRELLWGSRCGLSCPRCCYQLWNQRLSTYKRGEWSSVCIIINNPCHHITITYIISTRITFRLTSGYRNIVLTRWQYGRPWLWQASLSLQLLRH